MHWLWTDTHFFSSHFSFFYVSFSSFIVSSNCFFFVLNWISCFIYVFIFIFRIFFFSRISNFDHNPYFYAIETLFFKLGWLFKIYNYNNHINNHLYKLWDLIFTYPLLGLILFHFLLIGFVVSSTWSFLYHVPFHWLLVCFG